MNKNDSFLRKNRTILSCCAIVIALIGGTYLFIPKTPSTSSLHSPHVVKKSESEKPIIDNLTIKPNYIGKNLLKGN